MGWRLHTGEAMLMKEDIESRRLLRRQEVESLTGLSRATLYAMMAEGRFPKPLRLGRRSVGWRLSDIDDWLAAPERAYDPAAVK